MKFLKQYIEEKIDIDDVEWEQVASLFTKKTYMQGEEVYTAGEVNNHLYYVAKGVLRMYMIDTEGKEITWALNYHKDGVVFDPFSGDYASYLTQKESDFFCEAMSDSVVYITDFSKLDMLYESALKWMKLGKIISDTHLVVVLERIKMMKSLTAKEKYILIKNVAPVYEQELADYQFASVLGIAPQSLSRIKREMKDS